MYPKSNKTQNNTVALRDAHMDFVLSRQAMRCTPATMTWYGRTVGKFVPWLTAQGVTSPDEVTARYVRAYLAELTERNLASWTVNGHARAIRTLLIFWHTEGYMPELVKFAMPKVEKKRLPSLDAYQLKLVLGSCKTVRDKAIIMTFADSGLRRGEVIALNWGDVDISSGLIRVNRGKGGKARSVVVGAKTRRALLAYRRTLVHRDDHHPLFQTTTGGRFAPEGLRTALLRIGERAGIHLSPHALRRTFTILSLRAGMDLLHLQAMLGHESLEMVRHYAQLSDVDLLEEHKKHSPVDNL